MARDPIIQREWQRLYDRFVSRLIELKPKSVLDVGCGGGALVNYLNNKGVMATGIDPRAADTNTRIVQGNADELPFANDEFEWVTLRHVPHHLPNLDEALSECVRVAQKGLLIAEPWFDVSDDQQRIAEQWDLWWKRQHERAGSVHKPCISLSEIKRALPTGGYDIEVEYYRHDIQINIDAIEKLSKAALDALPETDADRSAYDIIIRQVSKHGFSYNGTMIATVCLGGIE